jgi:hypothetical protein
VHLLVNRYASASSNQSKGKHPMKDARLKIDPAAPHGLSATHKDQLNADLLAFLKA